MAEQKSRSRSAATTESGDWQVLIPMDSCEFVGYDTTTTQVRIARYRKQIQKNKEVVYQLVFDKTPFYAESGGQVGDTGLIETANERLQILDTQSENKLPVHLVAELPEDLTAEFTAVVNLEKREATKANHSATHLLQEAMRKVLGTHIEQKGSFVSPERLRFDFSHFQKVTDEEIAAIEALVNAKVRKAIPLNEHRNTPMAEAKELGALMFFGEKYGDAVRVIQFGTSIELCGGTHVENTANIGSIKIVGESAIAAGIRRIEAISAANADAFIADQLAELKAIKATIRNPQDPIKQLESILADNQKMAKEIEKLLKEKSAILGEKLLANVQEIAGIKVVAAVVTLESAQQAKDLAFMLRQKTGGVVILAANIDDKANITVAIDEELLKARGLNAGQIVREAAKEVDGGGGGQAAFATAGGKNPANLDKALAKALTFIK
jgi:alanyl-tRNA synthetase